MKTLFLEIDGKTEKVLAQKIKGKLWFHYHGKTLEYQPAGVGTSSGQETVAQDPTQIVAPMPGKIIKILKNVADTVSKGETVIAMEAMKMEYNLKATQDMKIEEIHCSENQTVSLGDKLVSLSEAE